MSAKRDKKRIAAQKQNVSHYYGIVPDIVFRLIILWIVQNGFRYAMFNPWLEGRVS